MPTTAVSPPPGTLVMSLDFELMWGMFDKVTNTSYGDNLDGVHEVVPKLLHLFSTHNIRATWAVVGLLAAADSDELKRELTRVTTRPRYVDDALSAYHHIKLHNLDEYPTHYFAPHLIKEIIATPHQELASHTYSHFYCLETQTGGSDSVRNSFRADCAAMNRFGSRFDTPMKSIVFPRNQWSEEALTIAVEHGITAYRGTEDHFIYRARTESAKTSLLLRGLRFFDRYINLTGHHTYPTPVGTPVNVPASRQLHPYTKKLQLFERLKVRRIKNGMTQAAKRGEIFHLWWHPHNFGIHQAENVALLTELLTHFSSLRKQYGMQSKTMQEVATQTVVSAAPTTSDEED